MRVDFPLGFGASLDYLPGRQAQQVRRLGGRRDELGYCC
jgi:hypothetical protein